MENLDISAFFLLLKSYQIVKTKSLILEKFKYWLNWLCLQLNYSSFNPLTASGSSNMGELDCCFPAGPISCDTGWWLSKRGNKKHGVNFLFKFGNMLDMRKLIVRGRKERKKRAEICSGCHLVGEIGECGSSRERAVHCWTDSKQNLFLSSQQIGKNRFYSYYPKQLILVLVSQCTLAKLVFSWKWIFHLAINSVFVTKWSNTVLVEVCFSAAFSSNPPQLCVCSPHVLVLSPKFKNSTTSSSFSCMGKSHAILLRGKG